MAAKRALMTSNAASSASASATNVPSREEFVREYMAQLSQNRPPKASLVDRLVGWGEDRAVSAVKSSKRSWGRLTAAWEIADAIKEEAYASEHAKHAEQLAARLGLR